MSYTAVQDRSTMDLSTVKALLGVTDSSQDALINLHLATAKEAADNYLNNPFHKWDMEAEEYVSPVVELAIPATVESGLVEYVRLCLLQKAMADAGQQVASRIASGEGASESVGGWSVSYNAPSLRNVSGDVPNAAAALRKVQEAYWDQYRLAVGF